MSEATSTYSGGILKTEYNTQKTFIRDNNFISGEMTNATGADITYPGGTLMGRISATLKLVPLASAATDGSQFPVGVLATDYIVEAGTTRNVMICNSGEVVESMVILQGADTLNTVITGRTIRDRIGADTVGVILRAVDDLSKA